MPQLTGCHPHPHTQDALAYHLHQAHAPSLSNFCFPLVHAPNTSRQRRAPPTVTPCQVAPRWRKLLEESLAAGHDTWLHQLFLGTIALEEGDVVKASGMLTKSLEMHPHPITARNLASFAGVAPALAYYQMAFSLWKEMDGAKDPAKTLLGRDLVSEYAIWLTYQGMEMELDELLSDKDVSIVILAHLGM